jgi:predicted transporter
MNTKPIWKWAGFITIAIFVTAVIAIRRISFMADPDPQLVIGLFIVLGIYSVFGGIITAKQAKGMPANMVGMLNTLTGIAWLFAAYGMATFPAQH